ncbi:MAG: hypothetical protein ACOCQR_02200 [bacterium]
MGVERVDYYSEDEYQQALMMEQYARLEEEEMQRAMEKEMAFEQLQEDFKKAEKNNIKLVTALNDIKQLASTLNENEGHLIEKVCQDALNQKFLILKKQANVEIEKMVFEQLLGEYRQIEECNDKLLNTLNDIKKIASTLKQKEACLITRKCQIF